MLGGLVPPAMFEANKGVLAEGHQIGQQKTVARLDLVQVVLRFLRAACTHRMPGKGQRHIAPTPVISSPGPFFCAGPLGLRRLAVIKEKPRISLERVQDRAVGENKGSAYKAPRPVAAA